MENAMTLIKGRRSTRKFLDKPIPQELLEQVLEAGRYAPSGKNVQAAHFLVIENRAILDKLAVLVREAFQEAGVKRPEGYIFHYDPKVLVVLCNRTDNVNNLADTGCALENMMLMASELELGSCWINQLKDLNENETINAYLYSLGMGKEERAYGALALGYPDSETGLPEHTPKERTGNRVTYVK